MQITGGKYNSRKIKAAEYDNIKPTLSKMRQGIFNTLAAMMSFEDKIFFDLFAGSGIMSLEAISRGFHVVSFEKDKKTAIAVEKLFKDLNLKPELYFGNALKNILKVNLKPDVIFIDPPYNSDLYEQSLTIIKNNNILQLNGIIIMEHPVDKSIKYEGFELIKTRTYGSKQITYINQSE
ncbi:MAG: 16S rRNA (guanine(966)-N(2))-methyltransferase RsmD [Candidatus Gastranaerophilales bacterium]|nr:16S rRNA (guanine(966)-N(2))-methyltransferase RsmD [Candidatus Gastranaerophilales bacterium]